jgi:hypothetical protein
MHWPPEDTHRISFALYSDASVYAREQERIFAGPNWSYVWATSG